MTKLEALLQYQKADLKKQQLENSVKSTDSRQKMAKLNKLLREQKSNIQKLTEEVEALQLNLAKLIGQQDKLAYDLELNEAEFDTMEKDSDCTAEELTEFCHDVDSLQKEMQKTEKDAKNLLQQLQDATERFQHTRALAGKAKKDYDQVKAVCEVEKTESASDISASDKELQEKSRQVDALFMEKYKRARLHHTQPVVPVLNCKCSGCNMSLPMAVLKKLSDQDTIVECENCGRILYQD